MATGQEIIAKAFQMAHSVSSLGAKKAANAISNNVSNEFLTKITMSAPKEATGMMKNAIQKTIFSGVTSAALFGGAGAVSGLLNGDLVDSTISGVKLGAMAGLSTGAIANAIAITGGNAYSALHPKTPHK